MAELAARGACDGLDLPLVLGGAVLSVLEAVPMLAVMPRRGCEDAVSGVLEAHVGARLPEPGAMRVLEGGGRLIWTGAGQWFLRGAAAQTAGLRAALEDVAAVTDQGDGWTGLHLGGVDAAAVLARLVPVDVEAAAFPPGSAARTLLGHVACVLSAEADGYGIRVMRSFTLTAVHDLERAMRAVAGIAALRD